jgi:hypothetical protein
LPLLGKGLFSVSQIARAVVDGSEGTNPAAKETTDQEGEKDHGYGPQKARIQGVGREEGCDRNQRVELQEPVYRPAPQLVPTYPEPSRGNETEKEGQEKHLADATSGNDSHNSVHESFSIAKNPCRLM